jgi:hypothetical protein
VKKLLVPSAILLLFGAGFWCVWFDLFHISVSVRRQLSPGRGDAGAATTIPSLISGASNSFPHFGRHGRILSTYTPGDSIWPRSMFYGGYDGAFANFTSDVQAAAINVFETGGFLRDPTIWGCNSSNFALSGGGGTWQTNTCGNWHDFMVKGVMNPELSASQSFGMPFLARTDTIAYHQNVFFSCGPTVGSCTPSWAAPVISDYTSLLQQYAQQYGMFVAQISPDEWGTSIATNPEAYAWAQDLGLEGTGTPHVPWGADPLQGNTTNMLSSLTSDYIINETGGAYSNSTNGAAGALPASLSDFEQADSIRAQVIAARGPVATLIVGSACAGISYLKKTNDTQYTPGVDVPIGNPSGTGVGIDQIMYTVAHGFGGYRNYDFDVVYAASRANDPICTSPTGSGCAMEQTGCSPPAAYSVFHGVGQDRWYASSAAYNIVKTVEPYVLQPMGTAPSNCDSTGNGTGDPFVCGVHTGNGGNLVIIINFSANSNSYTFNPAAYVFAGGTAQSWKIIGSTDGSCGPQTTLPSVSDCSRGPTQVIGATTVNPWTLGSVIPSPGVAPTTVTTLNMRPTEVNVFLYHQ